MLLRLFTISSLVILSIGSSLFAQSEEMVRLSGIVLRLDSIKPVSYANISVKNTSKGTISDKNGLFSMEISRTDTVVFSSIGSRTVFYVLPDTLTSNSYSIIQRLPIDTVSLRTVEITSWPTLQEFNDAFTQEYGFDTQLEPVDFNKMDPQKLPPTAFERNQYRIVGNDYSYVYENAHIPVKDLLNPKRWNKLVEKWKAGTY